MGKFITVVPKGKPSRMLRYPGIGFVQHEKRGRLVLKDNAHWTKISGIWINTKWGCVWIIFRRFARY